MPSDCEQSAWELSDYEKNLGLHDIGQTLSFRIEKFLLENCAPNPRKLTNWHRLPPAAVNELCRIQKTKIIQN